MDIHRYAAAPCKAVGAPADGPGQTDFLQQRWVQEIGQRPNLPRAAIRQDLALIQSVPRPLVERPVGLPRHRKIHGQSRQALGGTVVQLTGRSEEHTSELQSLAYLVCRLLL